MDRSLESMSRHSSHKPRKRAFEGSGVIDLEKEYSSEDSGTDEKMSNSRRKGKEKGKEIMVQEVIDVDDDDGCLDMIYEAKLGGKDKGKELLYVHDGSDSVDKRAPFFTQQSSSSTSAATDVIMIDDCSNNVTGKSSDIDQDDFNFFDGDDLDYPPENQWYGKDDMSYLQAQFENADIPTNIEVEIPWWLEPGHKNGKQFDLSGQSNLSSDLYQTAHSHDTKSVGGAASSVGFGCTEELKSVTTKHESLAKKHAADSFAPGPTEIPGGSSEASSIKDLKEAAMTRLQQFEKFAVVDDYADHHYVNKLSNMQLEKVSAKKIQDEWRILQSSLPDTIFVRIYESQMALLRIVIIGPQGTPYHDGLFFFDVMFPSNYPNRPPQVHYHSGGLRLNPNLYANGKVCLSLLGTWPGRNATENWIPGKSTLLQVLVSIQALILNANPYFNEPGLTKYGDNTYRNNASEHYNEETLVKSLKTMTYSMKNPPKHFEEFVPDHFITRSRDVLLACKEYMNGARVGSISIVDGNVVRKKDKWCSPNFKDRVGYILNSLIDEFAKLGVHDCDEFRVPTSMIKELPLKDAMEEWFGGGIFGKAKSETSSNQFMSALYPTAPGVPFPIPFQFPPIGNYAAPYPTTPEDAYSVPQPSPLPMMTPPLQWTQLVPRPFPQPHLAPSSSSTPWNPSLPVDAIAFPPLSFYPAGRLAQNVNGPAVQPGPHIRFPPQPYASIANRPVVQPNSPARSGPRPHASNANRPVIQPDPPASSRPHRPPVPNLTGQHHPPNYSWRKPSKPDDDLNGKVHKWSDV